MFCTVVIPTIARDSLIRAVDSVLNQITGASFELIVVNDSGRTLPPAAWQQDPRVQVIATQGRERCVARNTGAALARGRYLIFLDDDDWLLPGALQVFYDLARAQPAAWLYGASQLTDAAGVCLYQFDHQINGNGLTPVMAGEWVPLQSSVISADVFFAEGAFDLSMPAGQDKDILARVALKHDMSGTATPVTAILRGEWASSTDYDRGAADILRSREPILDQSGSFARLRASAPTSYWQGRLLKIFLISVVWNLRRWHVLKTIGRLFQSLASVILAGPHLLSADYWQALLHPHLTLGFSPAPEGGSGA